jgi:hypothetical protein
MHLRKRIYFRMRFRVLGAPHHVVTNLLHGMWRSQCWRASVGRQRDDQVWPMLTSPPLIIIGEGNFIFRRGSPCCKIPNCNGTDGNTRSPPSSMRQEARCFQAGRASRRRKRTDPRPISQHAHAASATARLAALGSNELAGLVRPKLAGTFLEESCCAFL